MWRSGVQFTPLDAIRRATLWRRGLIEGGGDGGTVAGSAARRVWRVEGDHMQRYAVCVLKLVLRLVEQLSDEVR